MKYVWYLFWCLYVASSPLWSGPGNRAPGIEGEVVDVEKLRGTHGTFRGFEWRKNDDEFLITSQRVGAEAYLANREEMQRYFQTEASRVRSCRTSTVMMQASLEAPIPPDYTEETLAQSEWWAHHILNLNERTEESYRRGEFLNILPRAGNLRINYPSGTIVVEDLKLAGDVILDGKRYVSKGDNYCYNLIILPCEYDGCLFGRGCASQCVPEHEVAESRYFSPYNGHNLIRGRILSVR